MMKIVSDPALAESLAEEGRKRVLAQYSEERYVEHYRNMVMTISGQGGEG